jgi:hypothetical protein
MNEIDKKREIIELFGNFYYSPRQGGSYLQQLPKTHFNVGEKLYPQEVQERLSKEIKDFGDEWNKWADNVGARRATVEEMLSIGDDEITVVEIEDD